MAYLLRRTDGKIITTIIDGGFDGDSNSTIGSTSLTFVGKNYGPYAEMVADNFMKLLENFSGNTAPFHPLSGQLWFDRAANTVKVFSAYGMGNVWRALGPTISSTSPSLYTGDTWFNTNTEQLFVRRADGSDVLIGPMAAADVANTEIRAESIIDTGLLPHKALSLFVGGIRSFVVSADPLYYPEQTLRPDLGGFFSVTTGINANTSISGNQFVGKASNSYLFDSKPSSAYFVLNIDQSTTGNIQIKNDTAQAGLTVGNVSFVRFRRGTSNYGLLEADAANCGWRMRSNVGSILTDLVVVHPANNPVTAATANAMGIFTGSPITTLDVNGSFKTKTVDLGSVSGTVNINTLAAGTYQVTLTGSTTLNIQNFTTSGQSVKIVITNTNQTVAWSGTTITWPNSVVSPNFAAGPAKIAAINLFRAGSTTIATYVTY